MFQKSNSTLGGYSEMPGVSRYGIVCCSRTSARSSSRKSGREYARYPGPVARMAYRAGAWTVRIHAAGSRTRSSIFQPGTDLGMDEKARRNRGSLYPQAGDKRRQQGEALHVGGNRG